MRKIKFVGVFFVPFAVAFAAAVGFLIVFLWNRLMPPIFGLPAIGFWQALGLLVLSRILFGRFGGWGSRMAKSRFSRGWKSLTPDERRRFRQAMGPDCPPKFQEGGEAEKV